MFKQCFPSLIPHFGRETRKKEQFGRVSMSMNFSELKDITVRVIHAGGQEELYRKAIPASQLMKKYPGMCVARPEVFRKPHESLLSAEDHLFPGQKYYIIPFTTVKKLKHRHLEKLKEPASSKGVAERGGYSSDGSVCSAKDFYAFKSRGLRKRRQAGRNSAVLSIQKPRMCQEFQWEPSLTSIRELSP